MQNIIKNAIKNNNPIENFLNIIIVISNPCLYSRRYVLFKEFIKRLDDESNINLFIVEMIYPNQKFMVTDENNKNHLQLKTDVPLWHKENMINLGVKYLLPKDYKAFAWIDADVEFDSGSWILDTLKILNGSCDIVQLFSHCVDMDRDENNLNIFNSFGYCHIKNKKYAKIGSKDYWHSGYAWAMTRYAYERIGSLYDNPLGTGDIIMALSLINKVNDLYNVNYSDDYNNSMLEFEKKSKDLKLGYIPGIIRHYYHGSKENRKYLERWEILMKHKYSPLKHLTYDEFGILVPTNNFSEDFKTDIFNYFLERKEDD